MPSLQRPLQSREDNPLLKPYGVTLETLAGSPALRPEACQPRALASQATIELAVEDQRVGVDDLLSGEDFFEPAVVG
jgi:hypothetical protein